MSLYTSDGPELEFMTECCSEQIQKYHLPDKERLNITEIKPSHTFEFLLVTLQVHAENASKIRVKDR